MDVPKRGKCNLLWARGERKTFDRLSRMADLGFGGYENVEAGIRSG
jgi:hypothetical protein